MKLYINSDLYRYLDRCWPLMPAEWSVAATSAAFVDIELDPTRLDELLRYMSMDLRYSESDDDERGQMLSHAMFAFISAQIEMQDANIIPFQ
jgi:hypothetical protein